MGLPGQRPWQPVQQLLKPKQLSKPKQLLKPQQLSQPQRPSEHPPEPASQPQGLPLQMLPSKVALLKPLLLNPWSSVLAMKRRTWKPTLRIKAVMQRLFLGAPATCS